MGREMKRAPIGGNRGMNDPEFLIIITLFINKIPTLKSLKGLALYIIVYYTIVR